MANKIIGYAKGRLFQMMIGVIALGVLLLSLISTYLTYQSFESLNQEVTSSLQAGGQQVALMLERNLEQVAVTADTTEQKTSKSLNSHLSRVLQDELKVTKQVLSESLLETTDAIAYILSAVSAEAILSKNYLSLVNYVKVANSSPYVVYAIYMRPDGGKPFTRYVNRKNPRVSSLIEKGEGRTPMDKLLSAAAVDPDIKEVTRKILFEGAELGSIRLGVSIESVNRRVSEAQTRFDKMAGSSGDDVKQALQTMAQTITQSLQGNISQVKAQSAKSNSMAQQKIKSSAETLVWIQMGMMMVVGLLILAAICVFFIMRVTIPINRLQVTMEDIAAGEGDLSQRLAESGNDEISKVAQSFNLFVSKIQKTLIHASNSTVELSDAASTLTELAHRDNDRVNQQLLETQQVATAISQMEATVHEIAQSADSAANAVRAASSEAIQGKEAMVHTVETIATLAAEVANATEVINKLEADSESIGSVLNVIGGIAEQTNLLALNAAIEAARAGDQGRGFAVVADEVRTLAGRTQESTSQIHGIIENLQNGTRNAAKVMNGGLSTARQTVETAGRAGESLDNIVESVTTILDMNNQIATASEQHTAVTQEIGLSVVRISEISEDAAAGSSQTAEKSLELSGLGAKLKRLIAQFRL
ncbi:MAG: methyl-accepting chemotaxis protein [Sedimenticola sp.]